MRDLTTLTLLVFACLACAPLRDEAPPPPLPVATPAPATVRVVEPAPPVPTGPATPGPHADVVSAPPQTGIEGASGDAAEAQPGEDAALISAAMRRQFCPGLLRRSARGAALSIMFKVEPPPGVSRRVAIARILRDVPAKAYADLLVDDARTLASMSARRPAILALCASRQIAYIAQSQVGGIH